MYTEAETVKVRANLQIPETCPEMRAPKVAVPWSAAAIAICYNQGDTLNTRRTNKRCWLAAMRGLALSPLMLSRSTRSEAMGA
jgi:hypothetical protein